MNDHGPTCRCDRCYCSGSGYFEQTAPLDTFTKVLCRNAEGIKLAKKAAKLEDAQRELIKERDDLRAQVFQVVKERDDLKAQVEYLKSKLRGLSDSRDGLKAAKRRIRCLRKALDTVRTLLYRKQEVNAVDCIDEALKADRKATR
jgi:septal ring factor EnvC (AmiA/AmiB activator)